MKVAKAATIFLRNGLTLLESMPSSLIEAANKGSVDLELTKLSLPPSICRRCVISHVIKSIIDCEF